MLFKDIFKLIPADMKDGEILTRTWKNGQIVKENREQTSWKPKAADLDLVRVRCECGNEYDTPRDCLMYLNHKNSFCGQCGESGKMSVV